MDNQTKQFLQSKNFNEDQIYMIEKFHEIANNPRYNSINDMIVESMEMKKNPVHAAASQILDAAILWQMALKSIKSKNEEMTAKIMDRLNNVLENM